MSNRRRYPTAPQPSTYGQNVQQNFAVQEQQLQFQPQVPMFNVESQSIDEQMLNPILQTQNSAATQQMPDQQASQLSNNVVAPKQTLNQSLGDQLKDEVVDYYAEQARNRPDVPAIKQSDAMQLTHSVLPYSQQELQKYKLPVGFVFQPLMNTDVPTINFNQQFRTNPPRCSNCKAYVNCYSQFTSSGRHVCNFCGAETVFDFEYERNVKTLEQRLHMPEYANEAYIIEAPEIYRARKCESFETFGLIFDVSADFVESGALKFVVGLVIEHLRYLRTQKARVMVSITLVNAEIHYVVFKAKSYELYAVPDVDDSFIPAPRDVIVSLVSRGALLLDFLERLPEIARQLPQNPPCSAKTLQRKPSDIALLAAINGAYNCMSGVGGKIVYFAGTGNTCGMGFAARKVSKDDIKTGFQSFPEFIDLGSKCALAYVSVDGYIFARQSSSQHTPAAHGQPSASQLAPTCENDIASLIEISRLSSGYLHYLPAFSVTKHADYVAQRLDATFDTFSSLESCTRMRVTTGVECKYFYGKGQNGSLNLLNLAHIDQDETFGCELSISEPLKTNQRICIQLSCLYTDKFNRRFIRIVTKLVKVGSTINFYNSVNPEVALTLLAKKVVIALRPHSYIDCDSSYYNSVDVNKTKHKGSVSSSSDYLSLLDGLMGQILTSFSHYFFLTNFTAIDQLPQRQQKFLTYLFSLTKAPFCRPVGARYSIDQRAAYMSFIEGATITQVVNFVYPLVYQLQGQRVRLSSENLQSTGIFVGGVYDQIVVFFNDGLSAQQVSEYCSGTVDLNDWLCLASETEAQKALQELILSLRQELGADYPVLAVSGSGRHKYWFLTGMIESRVDGLGWFDFIKLVTANMRKE